MKPLVTPSTLDRHVEQRLAEADVRYTKGRRTVIHALAGSDGPRSASELHDEIVFFFTIIVTITGIVHSFHVFPISM